MWLVVPETREGMSISNIRINLLKAMPVRAPQQPLLGNFDGQCKYVLEHNLIKEAYLYLAVSSL
jgi:hypothetical protein